MTEEEKTNLVFIKFLNFLGTLNPKEIYALGRTLEDIINVNHVADTPAPTSTSQYHLFLLENDLAIRQGPNVAEDSIFIHPKTFVKLLQHPDASNIITEQKR